MAGRGATTFQKRQKEQQRKERQQQKFEKRMEKKKQPAAGPSDDAVEGIEPVEGTAETGGMEEDAAGA